MTATIVSLRKPVHVNRSPMPVTRVLSPEARQAFASLDGRMNALRRVFSGPFTSSSAADEISRICEDIRIEAMRVARLSK